MGSHCGWEPATPRPLGGSIGTPMKYALAEAFTEGDTTAVQDGLELGEEALPWLRGVVAGASDGSEIAVDAKELIAAIEQHERVRCVRD